MTALRKWQSKVEQKAERVLFAFESECTRLSIPYQLVPLDIEFLGSLLYRLAVERIPDLVIDGRRYPAFLKGSMIGVDASDIPGRQRFSIGHEIAHHVLHVLPFAGSPGQLRFNLNDSPQEPLRFFRCTEEDFKLSSLPQQTEATEPLTWDDKRVAQQEKEFRQHVRREVEANQFSAAILMPAQAVLNGFREMQDIRRLAERFQVSRQAIETRLVSLELLPRLSELQASFW